MNKCQSTDAAPLEPGAPFKPGLGLSGVRRLRGTGARWLKFNLVGAIGIFVQLAALWALTALANLPYVIATALAVEAAVLHNFIWHEHYTWRDRRGGGPVSVLRRLLRFNLSTGAISIGGNLLLMSIYVGAFHLLAVVGNLLSIATCSIANFLVSDRFVFNSSADEFPSGSNPSLRSG
jgi:putative flippase GtrA